MNIIIESDAEKYMVAQASIGYALIAEGWAGYAKPGDIIGIVRDGTAYGARRNSKSIRIYLQRFQP